MFNKIIIVGNFTRDLELRYAPSGTAIGSTGIATTRKFKGADGQQREEVLFVDITFFGRTAEIANQYLKKGSKVLVEGRLKYDTWDDKDGNRRSKHSVVVETMQMLGSKQDSDNPSNQQPQSNYNNPPQNNQPVQQNNNYQTPPDSAYNQNQQQSQPNQNNYGQDQNKGYR